MWRSPLPNRIQPSDMRWRVGRSPTSRSIACTSCQGQPVSTELAVACAKRALPSTVLGDTMRDAVIGTQLGLLEYHTGKFVAFVTYSPEDATASQQNCCNSNLPIF